MANPVISISPVSAIGATFATINGTLTSNGTARSWYIYSVISGSVTNYTQSLSDTEYYIQFLKGAITPDPLGIQIPAVVSGSDPAAVTPLNNAANVGTFLRPILVPVLSAADPLTIAQVVYQLEPLTQYQVRLVARRTIYPGAIDTVTQDAQPTDDAKAAFGALYRREVQPYEEFFSATQSFTTLG